MPSKDKKKGKLTKAEKEKLKKEEAERKAQEEEEARLQAEQEEREREEKERKEREERRLLEEKERVRHQAEIDELNQHLEDNQQYLRDLRKSILLKNKWDHYMLCDGRPDPTDAKDINTFINLVKEDETELDIEKVLKKCEISLELIDELEQNISDASLFSNSTNTETEEENECHVMTESYKQSILDLQNLITYKIDQAVLDILKTPGKKIDQDTFNIQHVADSKNIKVCIWGNAAKNPRVKHIDFQDETFTMEVPKQMALANIAVRTLFVRFDFLSPKCSTYFCKPKKIVDSVKISEDEQVLEENNDVTKDEKPVSPSPAPSTKTILSTKESTRNNKSRTSSVPSTISEKEGNADQSFQPNLSSNNVSRSPDETERIDDEDEYIEEDVIDLRSFTPMGPLILVEILELPPQAKEMNGWIMQQVIDGGLQRIPYAPDNHHASSTLLLQQSSISTISNLPEKSTSSLGYNMPLALSIKIDPKVIFHEAPQVARWDETSQHWKTDGISDYRYEKDDGMVFFRASYFGPFAVMQDTYLNMPFQSWQLRPTALNECVFNICGAETEIDIIVKEGQCCVKLPADIKQIEHLSGIWMTPNELMKVLRSVGINLFPCEDGEKYVSVSKKLDGLISPLYKHMALSASAFSYTWSKWNTECGEEKVVLQANEWTKAGSPREDSYDLYMVSTRICCKLKMVEYCEDFSTDVYPESQMHPDLYHMLRDGASDEALKRLKDSSVVFIDCVHQLLAAVNCLVYS